MKANYRLFVTCCLSLAVSSIAWAADQTPTPTAPWVTETDTSHPSAAATGSATLAMPAGTLGSPATAQSTPTAALAARPPMSDTPPTTPVPPAPSAAVSPAATASPPPAVLPAASNQLSPSLADQMKLRNMVEAARDSIAEHVVPPPAQITVKSGITEVIPIAIGRMNRFLTPFHDPVIKTTSDASITRSGSIVYVASDTPGSISMFIMDKTDPEQAISLTLNPVSIPPVQVTLTLIGYEPKPVPALDQSPQELEGTPYVESIKALMRSLAQHHIPEGYAMWPLDKVPPAVWPHCHLPNVDLHLAQALKGHDMVAFVARAVDASLDPAEIDETGCAGDQVLAVAAWPRTHLEPGQDTELYIIVRAQDSEDAPLDRPSVLRSGE